MTNVGLDSELAGLLSKKPPLRRVHGKVRQEPLPPKKEEEENNDNNGATKYKRVRGTNLTGRRQEEMGSSETLECRNRRQETLEKAINGRRQQKGALCENERSKQLLK